MDHKNSSYIEIQTMETIIRKLSNIYEKLILMGDCNLTTSNPILRFLDTFALSSLTIDPTCFKNSKSSRCINFLLTNFKPSFMKINVFETSISDHNKMISMSWDVILQGKFLKQNTTESTVNLILISLVLNSPIRFNLLFYHCSIFLNLLNIQVLLKNKINNIIITIVSLWH